MRTISIEKIENGYLVTQYCLGGFGAFAFPTIEAAIEFVKEKMKYA